MLGTLKRVYTVLAGFIIITFIVFRLFIPMWEKKAEEQASASLNSIETISSDNVGIVVEDDLNEIVITE